MSSKTRKLRRTAEKKRTTTPAAQGHQRLVHLNLVTEPSSGRARLDLTLPVFSESWQNQLTEATANTAYATMKHQVTAKATIELAQHAMASTSQLITGLLARAPEGAVSCHAGCSYCCYQRVGVTPPEAFAILRHLLATRGKEQLSQLTTKVTSSWNKSAGLSGEQRLSPELPCPFLEECRCSIYEVRPLACRGVNSLDAQACASKLHDPNTRAAFFRGELPGHSFQEPIGAVQAISAGLQLGLSEQLGLDMRPLDLSAVMAHLLEAHCAADRCDPTAQPTTTDSMKRWLDGQPLWDGAHTARTGTHAESSALAAAIGLLTSTKSLL